jgi:hypothetical protein
MLKHISSTISDDGWVQVLDENAQKVSLSAHLKVDVTGTVKDRHYFIASEGPASIKGFKGSIFTLHNGNPTLVEEQLGGEGLVFVEFDRNKTLVKKGAAGGEFEMLVGQLWLGTRPVASTYHGKSPLDLAQYVISQLDKVPIEVLTWSANPAPTDWSALEIPDAPHPGGLHYKDQSSFATVWFRIGHDGDRYLHPGRISAGCLTVDPSGWNRIYKYLVVRRKDVSSVGAVHVRILG